MASASRLGAGRLAPAGRAGVTGRSHPGPLRETIAIAAAVRHFLDPGRHPPDWSGTDPDKALRIAIAHAVAPIVFRASGDTPEVAGHFRAAALEDSRFDLALSAELCTLAEILGDGGIAFITLKGPALSRRLYGDPGIRASADLDVLVRPGDLLAARDLLSRNGYDIVGALHWDSDSACMRSRECELLMEHRERGITIDLHWRILPSYFASPFDRFEPWDSAMEGEIAGRRILELSPEHLLLFLCAHAAKHAFERLGWICDIAACLAKNDFDAEQAYAMARESRTVRQLALGVQVAAELLGAPTPGEYPRDRLVERLAREIIDRFLADGDLPTPERELIPMCMRMFETTRNRLRYLAGHMRPSDAEYQALHLPPALHFLYYPFRPLRLASRLMGRARRSVAARRGARPA